MAKWRHPANVNTLSRRQVKGHPSEHSEEKYRNRRDWNGEVGCPETKTVCVIYNFKPTTAIGLLITTSVIELEQTIGYSNLRPSLCAPETFVGEEDEQITCVAYARIPHPPTHSPCTRSIDH